jgi:NADH-quinone oxidoreductase subunit J
MSEIIFYCFAGLLVISALSVVLINNTVKAVLSLVFCFVNATGLILMTGVEFVSAILIIVYVGAVVVLFLFIVMTLNAQEQRLGKSLHLKYVPFFTLIVTNFICAFYSLDVDLFTKQPTIAEKIKNTQDIGLKLYTDYFLQFQLAGIILLVAMIGVIILSQRDKVDRKKQDVWHQITTDPKDRITIVNK